MSSTAATCSAGTAVPAMLAIASESLVMVKFVYSEEAWPFYFCCYDGCDIATRDAGCDSEARGWVRRSGLLMPRRGTIGVVVSGGATAEFVRCRRLIEQNGEQNFDGKIAKREKRKMRWRRRRASRQCRPT